MVEAADLVFIGPIDDIRIARIGEHEAGLAVEYVVPVALDDRPLIVPAGDRDTGVVLLRAIGVIGEALIDRHVVELRRRLVALRTPGLTRVERDRGAAVARLDDAVRITRVDPDTVMITVPS